jgi:hypothetical protein
MVIFLIKFLLLSVRNWLSVMMKAHRRKKCTRTRVAIVTVARKTRGLLKGTEIVSQVKGNGTEMNVE